MSASCDPELAAKAEAWRRADPDPTTRGQLAALIAADDPAPLAALFGRRLSFGTAGLRAVVGPGPGHMNRLVVRQTAFGLAVHARRTLGAGLDGPVVVGFDGRTDSATFADDVVGTLVAQAIDVVSFEAPVPTPLVGFAVRRLGAAMGVVITASHNPPAYNGIKIYWANGVQVVPPDDQGIATAIAEGVAAHLAPPWRAPRARGGRVTAASPALGAAYLAAVQPTLPPPAPRPADYRVAYSPLHGVGLSWVTQGLQMAGFPPPWVVARQAAADGTFPTLPAPNPEEPGVMREVIALAAERGAHLALATDPDADRLAVAAPTAAGWRQLTGDELGALLADALIPHLTPRAVFATTLVSSPLVPRMAAAAGLAHFCTPTGFKWLADGMRRAEAAGLAPALAYEEALGFAIGAAVWDKDGVGALLALVNAAHAWHTDGQTLWDRLADIAGRHGVWVTCQRTATGPAAQALGGGALRARPPTHIAGREVLRTRDLLTEPWTTPMFAGAYPPTDVLVFDLGAATPGAKPSADDQGAQVIVRPSGTEPKVKCYYIMATARPGAEGFVVAEARARARLAALADCHMRDT